MVQCPDCEAKDRITIAGRVFCANCGTPWAGQGTAEDTNPKAASTNTPPSPAISPSSSAAEITPVLPSSPLESTTGPATSVITPSASAKEPDQAVPASMIRKKLDHATAAQQVAQSGAVSRFIATESPKPLSHQPATPAGDGEVEIGTLDKAATSVLTDDQFNNLAALDDSYEASTTPPAPAPKPTPIPQSTSQASATSSPTTASVTSIPVTTPTPTPSPAPTITAPPQRLQDVVMSPSTTADLPTATSSTHKTISRPPQPMVVPTEAPLPRPASAADVAARGSQPISTDNSGPLSRDQALELALNAADSPSPQTAPSTNQAATNFTPLRLAVGVVLLLLVGGYIWQINYPNLALKVASARAGLSTTLPNYLPANWSLSHHIISNDGQVQYTALSDDGTHKVKISQTKSSWDSQAVLENYVLAHATNYTAVSAQGLTIYNYNESLATWVNRGSWFTIDGRGSGLSQDQIIKIATNL